MPGCAQFRAPLGRGVLTHDGARLAASGLLDRAQRAERARIVDRADQEPPRAAVAQVPAHRLEALAQLAVPVEVGHLAVLERRQISFMPTSMPVSRIFGRLPARSSASSTISSDVRHASAASPIGRGAARRSSPAS